jgi:hypothetical protein
MSTVLFNHFLVENARVVLSWRPVFGTAHATIPTLSLPLASRRLGKQSQTIPENRRGVRSASEETSETRMEYRNERVFGEEGAAGLAMLWHREINLIDNFGRSLRGMNGTDSAN